MLQDQLNKRNGESAELLLLFDQLTDHRDGQLNQLDERDGEPVEGLLLKPPDQLELQQLRLNQLAAGPAGQLGASGL